MKIRLAITAAILSVFLCQNVYSSPSAWRELEEGKRLFEQGELGEALQRFQKAISLSGTYPEGEFWIGRVFEAEGEYALAIEQYKKAYTDRQYLLISDDQFDIMYHLAAIHYHLKEYGSYEDDLEKILSTQSRTPVLDRNLMPAMIATFKNRGIDRYFILYRAREEEKVGAFGDIGIFYYKTGRYTDATMNLLMAITIPVSVIVDYMRNDEPEYEYYEMGLFLEDTGKSETMTEYLVSSGFFRYLYYLGSSLYAEGEKSRAEEIWRIVSRNRMESQYRSMAAAQLREPKIEPIIVYPKP